MIATFFEGLYRAEEMQTEGAQQSKSSGITCTSTRCEDGLHCFRTTRRLVKANMQGMCRACGADLVDWGRVHGRNLSDVDYTFEALKFELIRHFFWHIEIDEDAVLHGRRKGLAGLRKAVPHRIRISIAAAQPIFDGRQTPRHGNVIYYAQHATASCCRKCVEEWHGIPQGRPLTDNEVAYLSAPNVFPNTCGRAALITPRSECYSRDSSGPSRNRISVSRRTAMALAESAISSAADS